MTGWFFARLGLLWLTVVPVALAAGAAGPLVAIPAASGDTPLYTLDDCVDAALEGNAELARERHRRRELRGQGWQAMSTGLPSFDVSGTWSRSRDPSFLLDESFGGGAAADTGFFAGIDFLPSPEDLEAQTFWRSSLGSEWELNPFRIINALQGVKVRLKQHDHELAAAEHSTVERTMHAFHELSLHEERVAAVEADVTAREEFLEISRQRFRLELSTELDTLQAAVALANLRPELRRARKDLRNAASRLNILMGRDALAPIAIDPITDVENDPVSPEDALDLALLRPDLQAQELSVTFLEKQRGVLRSDQRPSLSVDGRYGYVARTAGNLADRNNDFWSANVTLNVPLFDGFFTKGRVVEVEGTIAKTRSDLVEARRQAQLETATALEELEAARENLTAAELNLKTAERALEQMTLRYELGKADWLDVLNSQSDRFLARSNLIRARYDVQVQTTTLKRALGIDPRAPLSRIRELGGGEDR